MLRKDFLIAPVAELVESRAAGADAVLLIAACPRRHELAAMLARPPRPRDGRARWRRTRTRTWTGARDGRPRSIGVNARDLETLEVDVDRALTQLARVPRSGSR